MFWKKKQEKNIEISEVKVTLKPLGKIQPGTYLTVIYGCILAGILFVIFFLPGIAAGGTYITFSSGPVEAGVWIDGKKAGVTPCEILVKQGSRTIEFRRPFYKTVTINREVGGFIFALPFLPLRDSIGTDLAVTDMDGLTKWALTDYASWAMVKNFSASYQLPPVLTEAAKSVRSVPPAAEARKLETFLRQAAYFTQSPFLARELLSAYAIFESGDGIFTQGTLLKLAKEYLELSKQNQNIPFWIYNMLPVYAAAETAGNQPEQEIQKQKGTRYGFLDTPWFKKIRQEYSAFLSAYGTRVSGGLGPDRFLNGIHFVSVPGGNYVMGRYTGNDALADPANILLLPHPVRVNAFYCSENEISNRQFKVFLDENQQWKPSQRETLTAQELANSEYLKDWEDDTFPAGKGDLPVTHISYYAARAYCEWLGRKINADASGMAVRLPLESEWEWAASRGRGNITPPYGSVFLREEIQGPGRVGSSAPNPSGLRDMLGNVWEWCETWYAPAAYLMSGYDPAANSAAEAGLAAGALKVIRGGSWANEPDSVTVYTRGGHPPSWCTEFLGFRVVLAEK
jgi:iron(II)-dependent oxidoreductase